MEELSEWNQKKRKNSEDIPLSPFVIFPNKGYNKKKSPYFDDMIPNIQKKGLPP